MIGNIFVFISSAKFQIMKIVIFLSALVTLFAFASCERCYECKLIVSGQVDKTADFCGSPEDADTYEAAGYTCSAK